jgi:small subunit ribosomal protein S7
MHALRSKNLQHTDIKHQDLILAKFINYIMKDGKKNLAREIVYDALEIMDKKTNNKGIETFRQALTNVGPLLEVRSKRIGGANYQVPVEVTRDRKNTLAMRWIITAAKARKGQNMSARLGQELLDAANNTGTAIKKKEDTHRMAESNRAFAHFARM